MQAAGCCLVCIVHAVKLYIQILPTLAFHTLSKDKKANLVNGICWEICQHTREVEGRRRKEA